MGHVVTATNILPYKGLLGRICFQFVNTQPALIYSSGGVITRRSLLLGQSQSNSPVQYIPIGSIILQSETVIVIVPYS